VCVFGFRVWRQVGRWGERGGGGGGVLMAMSSAPAVQRLYDVCKKVFTSTSVPSEAQVSNVRAVLGNFIS
jgi:hypothetical protein